MSKLNPADWDVHWRRPVVTSMDGHFPDNYDGEVLAFWQRVITGDQEHLVDLACGNGAIAWIADEILNRPDPQTKITGVDIATIDPFETLGKKPAQFPKVQFIGNTPLHELPFEDHSIDMVTSQWGLEYSDPRRVIPEISRILKSTARMAFVCHHEDSYILKDSRIRARKFDILLDHGDLHGQYLALNDLYNAKGSFNKVKADPAFLKITAEIARTLYDIRFDFRSSKDPSIQSAEDYLNSLAKMFPEKGKTRDPRRKKKILSGMHQLEATKARLDDLFDAALSADDYAALIGLIESAGFTIREAGDLLYEGRFSVGKALLATRA